MECTAGVLAQRIDWLRQMRRDTYAVAQEWVVAGCAAKQIDSKSAIASEEWLAGPTSVLRHLGLLQKTLEHLLKTDAPLLNDDELEQRSGSWVAKVFPRGWLDPLLFSGYRAEIRFLKNESPSSIRANMARNYFEDNGEWAGRCVVLGAGNVSSIGLQDVLNKVFCENYKCVLKLNPVNDYLGEIYEQAFRVLIEAEVLEIVHGGAEVGARLVHDAETTAVHITGSSRVHDAIVHGDPPLDKPITSELGCVTPIMIVPGEWSQRQLRDQAVNVASMLVNNASFNCNAAKVLVTAKGWPQRKDFLDALRYVLAKTETRFAYYPGAEQRHADFCAAYPDAVVSPDGVPQGHLPWVLASGLDAKVVTQIAFTDEAWCGVLAEVPLAVETPADFLSSATEFCNQHLFGNLSCGIIIDEATRKSVGDAYEQAINELRYGAVAVNVWPAVVYALGVTPWGAYPENSLENISSGIGFVHNTRMFEGIEKCVLEAPFRPVIHPPWMVNNKHRLAVAKAFTWLEARRY